MIISKTPYRISFFGGGTDFPHYYERFGGCAIGSTINKYCYISLMQRPSFFKGKHKIVWSKMEIINKINQIEHPCVKGLFKYFKIKTGLELHYISDLPANSGIGSSSAFCVGLINALLKFTNIKYDKKKLSELSIFTEQKLLKESVGSQDQVWAAYGGTNYISFDKNKIIVKKINISKERRFQLSNNLILFFTGKSRFSGDIEKDKIKNIDKNIIYLDRIKNLVMESKKILESNHSLDELGRIFNEYWVLKKKLSNKISNNLIDDIYNKAILLGAGGGKVIGAGGGGFILFFANKKVQKKLISNFENLTPVNFDFTDRGSEIIISKD
jgi:D-glycero-alpha-D-manno-heptose-7-phosphate kinase